MGVVILVGVVVDQVRRTTDADAKTQTRCPGRGRLAGRGCHDVGAIRALVGQARRAHQSSLQQRRPVGLESVSGLSGVAPTVLTLVGPEQSTELAGALVTGNHFDVLRTRASLGRLLRPADSRPGAEPVAVLGHGTWRQRFGGDPGEHAERERGPSPRIPRGDLP